MNRRRVITSKPVIYLANGWWRCVCRTSAQGTNLLVSGKGKKPQTAFNDYTRYLKWRRAGCPGRNY